MQWSTVVLDVVVHLWMKPFQILVKVKLFYYITHI